MITLSLHQLDFVVWMPLTKESGKNGGGSMEGSMQLQTLELSVATRLSFPPHSRWPLHSHTYFNLMRLLSHCPSDFPHLQTQGNIDDVECRQVSEENVSLSCGEMKSALLVPEDTLIQGTAIGKNKPSAGFQDECFDGKRTTIPKVNHINLVTDGEQEVTQTNKISLGDFWVDGKQNVGCSVQIVNDQENVDSLVELQTCDFGPLGQLELDKDFCIDDFSEVLDSCFGMDIVVESSKSREGNKENGSAFVVTMSKEFEHQVRLKEMELETLVSTSGAVDSSFPVTADEEIEEGGEKCKFSHDTIPLTKYKPCGHFDRHSCMKGDDCPFDHQLSKYPCNNYTSTGFCSRGADCLFSHEMPVKQIMSVTSNVLKPVLKSEQHSMPDKDRSITASKASKPEVKFIAQLNNLNSCKPADSLTSHHKIDSRFSSARDSPVKSTEEHVAKPFARIVAQAPKGVSFLSDAKMPVCHNRMLKIHGLCQKASDGVDVGHETILKVPGSINKLTEMSEGVDSGKPRGINFLSFAQSSLDYSSFKTFSNLFSNCYKETGKLVITDLAEGKQTRILPKSGDFFEVTSQISHSATPLAQNLNEAANRTPVTLPLHMNSLSLSKTQSDDSVLRIPADFSCNKVDTSLSSVQERTTPGNCPVKMPSLSFGDSWDQLTAAAEPSRNMCSSFKKSLLSNTPSLVQKAVQSTLAFAAKFEPEIKLDCSFTNGEARRSSQVDHGHS